MFKVRNITFLKAALIPAFVLTLVLLAPATMRADTYSLTLTPDSNSAIGGIGSFTIDGTPATSGNTLFSQHLGNLDALSFTLDGQTFSLAGDPGAFVEFQNGSLYDITFAETVGSSPNRLTLDTTSGYAFYYNDGQSVSTGSFSLTPNASPVPEPGSLALLGTGLLGCAGTLFRRLRAS
jgi:hypothetical protein